MVERSVENPIRSNGAEATPFQHGTELYLQEANPEFRGADEVRLAREAREAASAAYADTVASPETQSDNAELIELKTRTREIAEVRAARATTPLGELAA